jgi:hypothetical protein
VARFSARLWQRGDAQALPEFRESSNGCSLGQFMTQLFANLGCRQNSFALKQLPDFDRQR